MCEATTTTTSRNAKAMRNDRHVVCGMAIIFILCMHTFRRRQNVGSTRISEEIVELPMITGRIGCYKLTCVRMNCQDTNSDELDNRLT